MWPNLVEILTYERFSTYLSWASQNQDYALELYTLNTKLSESLYIAIQMLEIGLRNRIDAVLTEKYNDEWLLNGEILQINRQVDQRDNAIVELERAKKEVSAGKVIAALPFSFWTSMFNSEYETLWQQGLHKIGRKKNGKGLARKDISKKLTPIRILRNRIAHHEPIIHWNLPQHHENMVQLTRWFSPEAAEWCLEHCRFQEIYPKDGIILEKP